MSATSSSSSSSSRPPVHMSRSFFAFPAPVHKSLWKKQEDSEECHTCHLPFYILRRPHNCRQCGHVICGDCSDQRFTIEMKGIPTESRVCNQCYKFLADRLEKHTGEGVRKKERDVLEIGASAVGIGKTVASGAKSSADAVISAATSSVTLVKTVASNGIVKTIACGAAELGKTAPVLQHVAQAIEICQKLRTLAKNSRTKHEWVTEFSVYLKKKEQMLFTMLDEFKCAESVSADLSNVTRVLTQVYQDVGEINSRSFVVSMLKATNDRKTIDDLKEKIDEAFSVAYSSMIIESKQQLNSLRAEVHAHSDRELKRILHPIDCSGTLEEARLTYQEGTRLSFQQAFREWIGIESSDPASSASSSSSSASSSVLTSELLARRVFWLKGPPGAGKTVISAMLANTFPSSVVALHFCKHDQPCTRSPLAMIRSIAFQIAEKLPSYQELLVEKFVMGQRQLSTVEEEAKNVWKELLVKPLNTLNRDQVLNELHNSRQKAFDAFSPSSQFRQFSTSGKSPFVSAHRAVIIIDALDESENAGSNSLLTFLSAQAQDLPQWVGIAVSSRPECAIEEAFSKLSPLTVEIKCDDKANQEDIKSFLAVKLEPLVSEADLQSAVAQVWAKSNGLFLYCATIVDYLERSSIFSLKDINALPHGLDGFYLKSMIRIEEQIRTVLEETEVEERKNRAFHETILERQGGRHENGKPIVFNYKSLLSLFDFILSAFEPLSFAQLSTLSGLSLSNVQLLLKHFHAFLRIRYANEADDSSSAIASSSSMPATVKESATCTVEVYHRTFKEWMTDEKRLDGLASERVFFVDLTKAHLKFAQRCFDLLLEAEPDLSKEASAESVMRAKKEFSLPFSPPLLIVAKIHAEVEKPIGELSTSEVVVPSHGRPLRLYLEHGGCEGFVCDRCTSRQPDDGTREAIVRFGDSYSCTLAACKFSLCSRCFLKDGGYDPLHIDSHRRLSNRKAIRRGGDIHDYCIRFGSSHAIAAAELKQKSPKAIAFPQNKSMPVPIPYLSVILSFLAHPQYLHLRALLDCTDSLPEELLRTTRFQWQDGAVSEKGSNDLVTKSALQPSSGSEISKFDWLKSADGIQLTRCLEETQRFMKSCLQHFSIDGASELVYQYAVAFPDDTFVSQIGKCFLPWLLAWSGRQYEVVEWKDKPQQLDSLLMTVQTNCTLLVISPDGRYIACLSDEDVELRSVESLQIVRSFKPNRTDCLSVTFNSTGTEMAVMCRNTVFIVNCETCRALRQFDIEEADLSEVDNLQGSSRIVWVGDSICIVQGNSIKRWHAHTLNLEATLSEHANSISKLAASKDGRFLCSAANNGTEGISVVWSMDHHKFHVLLDKKQTVTAVAFSDSGDSVFICSAYTVRHWSCATGEPIQCTAIANAALLSRMTCFAAHPTGHFIVASTGEGKIVVVSLMTGKTVSTMKCQVGFLQSLTFSTNGDTIFSLSRGSIHSMRFDAGSPSNCMLAEESGEVLTMQLSGSTQHLAIVRTNSAVQVSDVDLQRKVSLGPVSQKAFHVAFNATGNRLLSLHNSECCLFDTNNGQVLRRLRLSMNPLSWLHDGDVNSKHPSQEITSRVRKAAWICASDSVNEGYFLCWDEEDTLFLYSAENKIVRSRLHVEGGSVKRDPYCSQLAVGNRLAATRFVNSKSQRQIKIWKVEKKQLILIQTIADGIRPTESEIAMSSDDSNLFVISRDGHNLTQWKWNAANASFQSAQQRVLAPAGWINSLRVSPNGCLLAALCVTFPTSSVFQEWKLRILSTDSLVQLSQIEGVFHSKSALSIAFPSDGSIIIASGSVVRRYEGLFSFPIDGALSSTATCLAVRFEVDRCVDETAHIQIMRASM